MGKVVLGMLWLVVTNYWRMRNIDAKKRMFKQEKKCAHRFFPQKSVYETRLYPWKSRSIQYVKTVTCVTLNETV